MSKIKEALIERYMACERDNADKNYRRPTYDEVRAVAEERFNDLSREELLEHIETYIDKCIAQALSSAGK